MPASYNPLSRPKTVLSGSPWLDRLLSSIAWNTRQRDFLLRPPPPFLIPLVFSSSSLLLELLQDLHEEVLEAEGDVAVAVVVVLLEDVGHALEGDAGLDEEVEAHDALGALVVGVEEELDEAWGEAVAEGDEGVAELIEADVTAAVYVELVEQRAPRRQE